MNERTNEKCRKNSLLIVMFSGFDIWPSGSICQLAIFIEKSDNLATAAPRLTLPKSLGAIFLLWNPSLSTWKRLVCGTLKLEMKGLGRHRSKICYFLYCVIWNHHEIEILLPPSYFGSQSQASREVNENRPVSIH